jgi:hypothetical protein
VVETAIRRVKGPIGHSKRRPVVSNANIDTYKIQSISIGHASLEISDAHLILPKPASM